MFNKPVFYLLTVAILTLLTSTACKDDDKANLSITFCNGGMVPDSLKFSETNLSGSNFVWQLFSANGSVLSQPTSTNGGTVFVRFDSAGTYRMRVDVDNQSSDEVSFTLTDFISEGTNRGVSFYDQDLTIWTVYPDNDCHAAVRVKNQGPPGGIDYYGDENKLIYVPDVVITCFPNGEDLETVSPQNFSLRDVVVDQSNGVIYFGAFDFDSGDDVILKTTFAKLPLLSNDEFDERFVIEGAIGQMAFDQQNRVFYTVNSSEEIRSREATKAGQTITRKFGSDKDKTAVVFDNRRNQLLFAEGVDDCSIVIVDPAKPEVRLTVINVLCDGQINGIDLDEVERELVYTDGENVRIFSVDNPADVRDLILSNERTIRKDVLDFDTPIEPPILDVVIARYKN